MSATDIAKEAIRIVSTAGLGKDVIDLLRAKIAILVDENVDLKSRLTDALSKISILEAENEDLKKKLKDHDPLPDCALKILEFLANGSGEATVTGIVHHTGMQVGEVMFSLEQMSSARLIGPIVKLPGMIRVSILPAGRELHFKKK